MIEIACYIKTMKKEISPGMKDVLKNFFNSIEVLEHDVKGLTRKLESKDK